jgi:hypothetical protein
MTILLVFISTGCHAEMTGTVIDAETEKPIEGAVVLVNWTITKGVPGLTYGEDYKTVEAITDKEGKFRVFGVLNPFVNPPTIVVYKKGYVAWRNDFIFPDYKKREDFQWTSKQVFRMEHFKKIYSHYKHIFFFSSSLSLDTSSKLYQAYIWEDLLSSKEEDILRKKIKTLKPGEKEDRIWNEIIQELYLE